jgi:hypothetical protein
MPIKYLSWTFAASLLSALLCVCGVRTQSRTNERTAPSCECVFSVSSFHAFLAVVSHLYNYVSLAARALICFMLLCAEKREKEKTRKRLKGPTEGKIYRSHWILHQKSSLKLYLHVSNSFSIKSYEDFSKYYITGNSQSQNRVTVS